MNYRSVLLLGHATLIENTGKELRALQAFTNKLIPGRWEEGDQHSEVAIYESFRKGAQRR